MKKNIAYLLVFILLFTSACRDNEEVENLKPPAKVRKQVQQIDEDEQIKRKIKEMTLEERIGQSLIVGFEGTSMNERLEEILDLNIGGLIYFDRNIVDENQLLDLNRKILEKNKSLDNIPLFLSIDEEGGIVSRLKPIYGESPNMKVLGDRDEEGLSQLYGKILGLKLKYFGFNLNFAPVLDINSNINNQVIGERAFGKEKEVVIKHSNLIYKELDRQNIIASGKHFPGHGDTLLDSHHNMPVVNKTREDLLDLEMTPFIESIKAGMPMIMVSHIKYTDLDRDYPASLSKIIINDLLKEELNFKGLTITDDLTMGAILENYSLEEAVVRYFNSGGDIALICHDTEDIESIIGYIKENTEESDINERAFRILKMKEQYKIDDKIETIDMDYIRSLVDEFNERLGG